MTDTKRKEMPKWPERPLAGYVVCNGNILGEHIDYQRARADAWEVVARQAVALLNELAAGDDWIDAAVKRFHERIGPLPW